MWTARISILTLSIACRGGESDSRDTSTSGSDVDSDTHTDSDTDAEGPFVVSCDTAVEETGPCTVDADGDGTWLTIQEAVDAASEGDVITVCPGIYDAVVIDTVGVRLQGYGADSTCVFGDTGPAITISGTHVAASPPRFDVNLVGLTISGTPVGSDPGALYCVWAGGTYTDVRLAGVGAGAYAAAYTNMCEIEWVDVVVEDNSATFGIMAVDGVTTVRHGVLRNNDTTGLAASYGTIHITNNVFLNNFEGLSAGDTEGEITNNVFYGNAAGICVVNVEGVRNNVALQNWWSGFCGSWFSDHDYNVAWDNPEDYSSVSTLGAHDMTTDPMFVDPAGGDFRLQSSSPIIDGGDPDPAYNDTDGTRNDIGIFGGPYGSWTPP